MSGIYDGVFCENTERLISLPCHCVTSVQIRSFSWSVFSCIWTEYVDLLRKSPYSVQIRESTDQKELRIWRPLAQCAPED